MVCLSRASTLPHGIPSIARVSFGELAIGRDALRCGARSRVTACLRHGSMVRRPASVMLCGLAAMFGRTPPSVASTQGDRVTHRRSWDSAAAS